MLLSYMPCFLELNFYSIKNNFASLLSALQISRKNGDAKEHTSLQETVGVGFKCRFNERTFFIIFRASCVKFEQKSLFGVGSYEIAGLHIGVENNSNFRVFL